MSYTTLSPTDYANAALLRLGVANIAALTDQTSQAAIACNTAWNLAYLTVSAAAQWSCLLTPSGALPGVPQTPLPPPPDNSGGLPPVPSPVPQWAPNTAYAANTWLQFQSILYITNIAYTSSNNFLNDLTTGALIQANEFAGGPPWGSSVGCGPTYPSGWAYQYQLPSDFLYLGILNDNEVADWKANIGDDYEIMQGMLYTNASQAAIKYVQNVADTTLFDPLFGECLTFKLAAMVATPLKQDGGRLEQAMEAAYERKLSHAILKGSATKRRKRPNLTITSRFVRSRFSGGIAFNNG